MLTPTLDTAVWFAKTKKSTFLWQFFTISESKLQILIGLGPRAYPSLGPRARVEYNSMLIIYNSVLLTQA